MQGSNGTLPFLPPIAAREVRLWLIQGMVDRFEALFKDREATDKSGLLADDSKTVKFDGAPVREYRSLLRLAAEEAGDRPLMPGLDESPPVGVDLDSV